MPPMDLTPTSASVVESEAVTSAPRTVGSDPDSRSIRRGRVARGARSEEATGPDDPQGPPFSPTVKGLLVAATVVVLAASLVLRFWTRSDLWLDEALTVNIAGMPLHEIPSYLRRDGSPPLYYYLLHFWMQAFGTSDLAVRSLSGIIGVITLPLIWLAGKRLGGRELAWPALLLLASSPFAIRYDTEARMYSLVALLTVLGFLALDRSLRSPRAGNLIAVGVVTGLLLYTHYWALYLVGTVILWLAWVAWRGRDDWRRGARASLVAAGVGCLTFVPWLPTFFFQTRHTGTPWATTASFASMVSAVSSFAGGGTNSGRALALMIFALAGLGVFGAAVGRRNIDLDLRTQRPSRPLTVVMLGTLAAALAGGILAKSTFDTRYASVVFIPLILLVALGVTCFLDRRIRLGVLALAIAVGLAGAVPNIATDRTQAGQVARAIAATAHPGDVIAYCPDQLGPAVNRLLPAGRYRQTTFPRGTGPAIVNWVDYADTVKAASPADFAQKVLAMAAGGKQVYVVWYGGYQGYSFKCENIVETLQMNAGYRPVAMVQGDAVNFYQPMSLVRFVPTKS